MTGDNVRKLFDYAKENQVRNVDSCESGAFLTFLAVRNSCELVENVCFDLY